MQAVYLRSEWRHGPRLAAHLQIRSLLYLGLYFCTNEEQVRPPFLSRKPWKRKINHKKWIWTFDERLQNDTNSICMNGHSVAMHGTREED